MHALPFILSLGLLLSPQAGSNSDHLGRGLKSSAQKPEQSRSEPGINGRHILKPESLSPYLIEWYIDVNEDVDLRQIWRLLKIEISDPASYRCGGNCNAETFEIDNSDDGRGETVALKISFETGDFYQYLIFRKEKIESAREEWRLIGNIESRGQKYAPPLHRIERADNRAWFIIRELWNQGPKAKAYADVWYEIKERELKRVLSYPVEGHNAPCQKEPRRSYKSILLRYGLENGAYTVPVQFLVSYDISDCSKGEDSHSLFTKAQKAYYVWSAEKEQFVLDKSRSEITEREIGSVYHAEGLSYEMFVEYNFNELLEMARAGDAKQKDWLRKTLNNLADSQRKAALWKTLQQ
jgi:hypothetical protein